MKIVIDINEKDYEYIKELGFNGYIDQTNRVVEAIANGTSLEEELENIKSDIKEILSLNNERDMFLPASYICKLVNKHIAELKGENK